MKKITSVQNQLVKDFSSLLDRKTRDQKDKFIIEGKTALTEAISTGLSIEVIAVNEHYSPDESLLQANCEHYVFAESCMKKISSVKSPPNVAAIVKKPVFNINNIFSANKKYPLILILDGIKDPGNLGTIIRTACAADASGIIIAGQSVDLFNPKIIRSTAGFMWKIPVITSDNTLNIVSELKNAGYKIYSTSLKAQSNYSKINYSDKSVIVFGSEADGVSESLINNSDELVKIDISPNVESLNVAASVAVILFERARQKDLLNA